jgi:hypothetical protein
VPFNVTFWDDKLSKVTVTVPVKALAVSGSKVTVKFAHFAGAIVTGIVPPTRNSRAEDVKLVTVTLVVPRLYTVTICGALIDPDRCGLKDKPVGNTDADVPPNAGRVAIKIPQTANTTRQALPNINPRNWRIQRLLQKVTAQFGGNRRNCL